MLIPFVGCVRFSARAAIFFSFGNRARETRHSLRRARPATVQMSLPSESDVARPAPNHRRHGPLVTKGKRFQDGVQQPPAPLPRNESPGRRPALQKTHSLHPPSSPDDHRPGAARTQSRVAEVSTETTRARIVTNPNKTKPPSGVGAGTASALLPSLLSQRKFKRRVKESRKRAVSSQTLGWGETDHRHSCMAI